jgi:hypothetical protein
MGQVCENFSVTEAKADAASESMTATRINGEVFMGMREYISRGLHG